ncbi:MAG: hypothetical protein ACT4ON_01500 [Bacteroidota bacterium]
MKSKFLTPLVVLTLIYSCKDFVETDLSKKSVVVLTPTDNYISSTFTVAFKWEIMEGADRYQMQIVKPDFGAIQQFMLDTTVITNRFSYTLEPGTYQWRLKALNGSSSTAFSTYNFSVDSTLDLSGQPVILLSPDDNYYSNTLSNTFTWQAMFNADSYVFQIPGLVIQSPVTPTTTYTFASEGIYQWRVSAQNDFSNSNYTTRTITIDITAPATAPTPVAPQFDTITANPVPVKWNTVTASDSVQLLISTDSLFALVPEVDTTIANSGNPVTYNLYSPAIGTDYYWKVRAIDKARNKGPYSARRRFKRK